MIAKPLGSLYKTVVDSVKLNGLTSLVVLYCFLVSVFSERIVKVLLEHFA